MNEGKDCILSKSGEKEKNERRKRRMPSCSVASEFVDDPVVWVVVTSITRTRQKRSTWSGCFSHQLNGHSYWLILVVLV